jgi:hypothetical protein
MPEHLRDHLGMHALQEQERRSSVATIYNGQPARQNGQPARQACEAWHDRTCDMVAEISEPRVQPWGLTHKAPLSPAPSPPARRVSCLALWEVENWLSPCA